MPPTSAGCCTARGAASWLARSSCCPRCDHPHRALVGVRALRETCPRARCCRASSPRWWRSCSPRPGASGSRSLRAIRFLWSIAVAAFVALFAFSMPIPLVILAGRRHRGWSGGGSRRKAFVQRRRSAATLRRAPPAPRDRRREAAHPPTRRLPPARLPHSITVVLATGRGASARSPLGARLEERLHPDGVVLHPGRARHLRRRLRGAALRAAGRRRRARMDHGRPDDRRARARRDHAGPAHHGGRVRGLRRRLDEGSSSAPTRSSLAGALGAAVATWFTFLPSFLFILAGAPLIERTRDDCEAHGAAHRDHRRGGGRDREPHGLLRLAGVLAGRPPRSRPSGAPSTASVLIAAAWPRRWFEARGGDPGHRRERRWRAWRSGPRAPQDASRRPDLPPRFSSRRTVAHHHAAVDGLAHVVDGEQRHLHRGERLHLDPGARGALDRGAALDARMRRVERELDRHRVSGNGWQSGISSAVRFGAWIAAMRATPSTSPFFAVPASTNSNVAGSMRIDPRGHGHAMRLGLRADVNHLRLRRGVEMGEFFRHNEPP